MGEMLLSKNLEPCISQFPIASIPTNELIKLVSYRERLRAICDVIASDISQEKALDIVFQLCEYGNLDIPKEA